MLLLHRQCV